MNERWGKRFWALRVSINRVTFPLTPALSLGERVKLCRTFCSSLSFELNPAIFNAISLRLLA